MDTHSHFDNSPLLLRKSLAIKKEDLFLPFLIIKSPFTAFKKPIIINNQVNSALFYFCCKDTFRVDE
jgi:hypothetical protein